MLLHNVINRGVGRCAIMILKYKALTSVGTLILLFLGREQLLKENLVDNGPGDRAGEVINCDSRSEIARTEDGTCNDTDNGLMGAVGTSLGRNVKKESVVKDPSTLMMPNPIEVSRELFKRKET